MDFLALFTAFFEIIFIFIMNYLFILLEARLKSIFYYGIVVTLRNLKRLSSQISKLRNEIFFPNTFTTFLIFPENLFSRASISTRASTGTFTLIPISKR